MMRCSTALLLIGTVTTVPLSALARNPQPALSGIELAAAPPDSQIPPPENTPPHTQDDGHTLSDRLSRQRSTLHPRNVDPGINVIPPAGRQSGMPVIPPPGSHSGPDHAGPR